MATILLVDDQPALMQMFAAAVTANLGHDVVLVDKIAEVDAAISASPPLDLALVDLSFPHQRGTGLDVLAVLHRQSPSTKLVILTSGDASVAQLLRDAWELLPLAGIISKTAKLPQQLDSIQQVLKLGSAPLDADIRMLLPSNKSMIRSIDRFGELVPHKGHAKLWAALIDPDTEATYKRIADVAGLRLNTVKNYRASLLGELALHGLEDPSLPQMREFAIRCRPFLWPYVEAALARP